MKEVLDQFTVENFKAWLDKQDSNRSFDYLENETCLFASFLKESLAVESVWCGVGWFTTSGGDRIAFPGWTHSLDEDVACLSDTFTVSQVKALDF